MAANEVDREYPVPCRKSSGICNDMVRGNIQSVGLVQRKFFEQSRRAPMHRISGDSGDGYDEIVSMLQTR